MLTGKGRLGIATLACVGLAFAISSTPAAAWTRGNVSTFALIPSGFPMVEGLTVGPDGKVYSPTFDPTAKQGPSQLFTFGPDGKLLASVPIQGSSPAMLGLEVIPGTTNALLVIDFGAGQVLAVNPANGDASPCITLDTSKEKTAPGLNGITFDQAGNIYVSDSFNGFIWRYSPKEGHSQCGQAEVWVSDPTLEPNSGQPPEGVPPFGAMALNSTKRGLRCSLPIRRWIGS